MTYQCNILQRYDIYDNFKFFFASRHFHRKVPMQFISCDRTSYNLQTQTQSSYLTRNKSDFNNISYLLHILRCNQNMSHQPKLIAPEIREGFNLTNNSKNPILQIYSEMSDVLTMICLNVLTMHTDNRAETHIRNTLKSINSG